MNDAELRFLFDIRDNHQPIEGNEDKIRQYLGLLLSDRDVMVKALREKPEEQETREDDKKMSFWEIIEIELDSVDWELIIRSNK